MGSELVSITMASSSGTIPRAILLIAKHRRITEYVIVLSETGFGMRRIQRALSDRNHRYHYDLIAYLSREMGYRLPLDISKAQLGSEG